MLQIATLAISLETNRQAAISNARVALGKNPSEALTAKAKQENTIGIATARMPTACFPRGMTDPADKLTWVRDRVTFYVAPAKPNPKTGKANKLRAGKIGYRTDLVHRVIRNAEDATSRFFAELALSGAKTIKEKNDQQTAKRKAGGAVNPPAKGAAPSHAELIVPAKPVTSTEYGQHMLTQLASLIAYDSKNAKVRPVECSELADKLMELKQIANKAVNAYQLRIAAQAAK
jgi:hypothetical protein